MVPFNYVTTENKCICIYPYLLIFTYGNFFYHMCLWESNTLISSFSSFFVPAYVPSFFGGSIFPEDSEPKFKEIIAKFSFYWYSRQPYRQNVDVFLDKTKTNITNFWCMICMLDNLYIISYFLCPYNIKRNQN